MIGLDEFSRVVSRIHTAVGHPEQWDGVFADITRCLDATACTVVRDNHSGRSLLATTIAPEAASAYESYYHQLDFVVDACQSGSVGVVRSGWEIVDDNRDSEFYHDWQRRFEMTDGLLVRLTPTKSAGFVVSAPPRDQPYGTADRVKFVNALVPHIQHAFQTDQFLQKSDLRPTELTAVGDVIRHGIVVVALGGHIVTMNSAAQRIVRSEDGLRVRGNKIAASLHYDNAQLQAGIADAVDVQHNRPRTGANVICGRTSGKRPYILRLVPLDIDDDPSGARVAIIIVDPDHEAKPSKQLLRTLFGLTAAETEVALRMLGGEGLQAIADDLTVSIGTVKTHVHRLFHKTGTHRQGELIRLLVNVIA